MILLNTKNKKILYIFLISLPLLITLIALNFLPEQIPAHYGANGEVTRWGSKYESLIVPIISIFFGGIMFIITQASLKNPENKNNAKTIFVSNLIFALTFNVLTIVFLITSFNKVTNLNDVFSSKLISIALGISIILIGYILPKCKRNGFIGIRTPATLVDDDVWFKTHKFFGKLFIILGCIFSVIACFIPLITSIYILIASLIIISIFAVIYSRNLAKQKL